MDKGTGEYADPGKIREARHSGRFFRVRGPLNIARPAGPPAPGPGRSSPDGRDFAARFADVIFTVQHDKEAARETAAARRSRELSDLIVPRRALAVLGERLGMDLGGLPLGAPLPRSRPPPCGTDRTGRASGSGRPGRQRQGRYEVIRRMAEGSGLTLRQVLVDFAPGRGRRSVAGSPRQVADALEEWFADARPTGSP